MTDTATYDADLQLFINGAWRSGEGREARPVYNPATAATIAELPVAPAPLRVESLVDGRNVRLSAEDAAVFTQGDFGVVNLAALLGGCQEVFGAVFDPFDRSV